VQSLLPLLWMPLLLALFALYAVRMPYKTTQHQIYETESSYNYIKCSKKTNRYLRLNEDRAFTLNIIHSRWFSRPWEQFLVAPSSINPNHPTASQADRIIGLAGGTIARQVPQSLVKSHDGY
jgi:hypothetical protein